MMAMKDEIKSIPMTVITIAAERKVSNRYLDGWARYFADAGSRRERKENHQDDRLAVGVTSAEISIGIYHPGTLSS